MLTLSVVIIGKNAAWSIERLLRSVVDHTRDCWEVKEIIYVDSASTDHTVAIVSRHPVTIAALAAGQLLCASAGRYVGSHLASGDLLLFLDSDMELLPGWLPLAFKVLHSRPEIAAIGGAVIDCDRSGALAREKPLSAMTEEYSEVPSLGGAAMIRRSALLEAGNWNPHIISDEEPELYMRIRRAGYRAVRLKRPMVLHYGYAPPTMASLLARRKRCLFLGSGQVIRYHIKSSLIVTYLRGRGFALLPLSAAVLFFAAGVYSFALGTALPCIAFALLAALVYLLDSIRSKSFYVPAYHLFHRLLICEGTLRGLLLPLASGPPPVRGSVSVVRYDAASASVEAADREWSPLQILNEATGARPGRHDNKHGKDVKTPGTPAHDPREEGSPGDAAANESIFQMQA